MRTKTKALSVMVLLCAAPATSQHPRATAAAPSPTAAFDNLDAGMAGLMMVLKFRRSLLDNDKLVQMASLFITRAQPNCQEALPFANEFDARAATASARARLTRYLDAVQPRIKGLITFDLGTYDASVGGFPIGNWKGDNHLYPVLADLSALTPYSKPPTNVGANVGACGINPFPSQRMQVRLTDPTNRWFSYLMMPEAAARAYAASHPGRSRRVDIATITTITGIEEVPNSWRGLTSYSPPAMIFNLVGRQEVIRVEEANSRTIVPGRVTFRQTAPTVLE